MYNQNPTPPYRIGSTAATVTNNAPVINADLALALSLLERYLPVAPCLLVTVDSPARHRCGDAADELLPTGSCLAHWQYDGQPCKVGRGQQLLRHHGVRP